MISILKYYNFKELANGQLYWYKGSAVCGESVTITIFDKITHIQHSRWYRNGNVNESVTTFEKCFTSHLLKFLPDAVYVNK